jgi:hypothetical protein
MNQPPKGIQDFIHFLEEGTGAKLLRWFLVVVLLGIVAAVYQFTEARNFLSPEAMDAAQLGRNVAEGRGYTTALIRPLSVNLLQERARAKGQDPRAVLDAPHPDLENPPVYPLLLAGLMKALPVEQRYALPEQEFSRRPMAEVAISALNLVLFGIGALLVFSLGKALFDSAVGWIGVLVFLGTELLWKFANSGLPTLLLMVLALALFRVLVALDRANRTDATTSGKRLLGLAVAAGALLGLLALTRYSAAWLAIPVLVLLAVTGDRKRLGVWLTVFVTFCVLLGPWVVRNWNLSGMPFGTATVAWLADTESFPKDRLERSQHPDFGAMDKTEPVRKTLLKSGQILQDDLPRVGGNWIVAFFLVSLFVPFRDPTLARMRWLLLGSLALLLFVQASVRSQMTDLSPVLNGENLLAILAPVLFVFGAAMLQLALDQIAWPAMILRTLVTGAIILLFSAPLLFALLPPKWPTLQDPAYRPAAIRTLADYSPPGSLLMSDIPWAMAWYGNRDCVWVTLRVQEETGANLANRREDVFTFMESRRPIRAVYISPRWANEPFLTRFFNFSDKDFSWGRYYLDVLLRENAVKGFPLKYVLGGGYLNNGHFFLAEEEWWGPQASRRGQ